MQRSGFSTMGTNGGFGLRGSLKAQALAVVMVLMIGLGCAGFVIHGQIDQLHQNWLAYEQQTAKKKSLVSQLKSNFGYGGAIHLFKNYVLRGQEKYVGKFESAHGDARKAIADYLALEVTEGERAQLRAIGSTFDLYARNLPVAVRGWQEGRTPREIDAVVKIDDGPALAAFASLEATLQESLEIRSSVVRNDISALKLSILVLLAVEICCLPILLLLFGRRVLRPVKKTAEVIQEWQRGQLELRLELRRQDEIGRMGQTLDAFAEAMEKEIVTAFDRLAAGDFTFAAQGVISEPLARANRALAQAMMQVRTTAEQIASGATQVADSSQTLSQGATEQASSLEEIAASMNQMAAQTKQSAENARQANQLSSEARGAAERGSRHMGAMVSAMTEINQAGQNIGKIIKTIDEIAFQTNLLALNAAVEAARAGQHGKGFAVVAEEVRNLAARSARAAQETAELIEGTVAKTANGQEIAGQTANALSEIVGGITKVSDLVAEIAAAASEQAEGIGQVNVGLGQIDQVTQQNTASAEESAAAAEELASQASQLQALLGKFRLQQGSGRSSGPAQVGLPAPAADSPGGLLRWSDAYSVNIGLIDRQHKQLVELVNQMFAALKSGHGKDVVGQILADLVDYTQKHFAEEERMMARHGYPGLEEHKREHAALVRQVGEYAARLEQGSVSVSSELFNFLKGWLINHIQSVDKQYGPFLNQKGVR